VSDTGQDENLLEVRDLEVAYGAIQVLWGTSLVVKRRQVSCVIGSNGAGKTTLVRAISGLVPVRRGRIVFAGEDLTSSPAHERVRHHLALVPEGRQLWPRMNVEENLLMGVFSPPLRSLAKTGLSRVYELFPRLAERRRQACGTLSGGEQQMCAIGRALISDPTLLILDEPSLGLAPLVVDQVFQLVRRIANEGVTILLAAQNAHQALAASDIASVMEGGRIVLQGPSEEVRQSDHVRRAYLGIDELIASA
jgi:branched-chain amino acid transport system ATP-binding protein